MIQSAVIFVPHTNQEDAINQRLTELGISADDFLQAVVIREESENSRAKIVVFYEVTA